MMLSKFVPSISDTVRSEIDAKLAELETIHDVRILFAVESGSRAWGFPSPDSDYDVRFVYVHRMDWYLSLEQGRDVIEMPIRDEFDIGGWELRKALNLLLKPNPVLLEWLSSPIRYRWDETVARDLIDLSEKTAFARACTWHHLHLGEGQWHLHIAGKDRVNFKKYFYVLRPTLALRWIRLRPDSRPPMNLQDLCAGLDLDRETLDDIALLLERKSRAREDEHGTSLPMLDNLITSELDLAAASKSGEAENPNHAEEANALFRRIVRGRQWK